MRTVGSSASMSKLAVCFAKFANILIKVNEYVLDENEESHTNGNGKSTTSDDLNIRELLKAPPEFSRSTLEKNSFILIGVNKTIYQYIHEKNFNLVVYLVMLIAECLPTLQQQELDPEIDALFRTVFSEKKFFSKVVKNKFRLC